MAGTVSGTIASFFSIWGIYIVNILLIIVVIFFERKGSTATLAWIMILAFIPIIGFILYLIFNQNLSRIKINKLLENEEYIVSHILKKQMQDMDEGKYEFKDERAKAWKHLIKLNQVYADALYTQHNEIDLITDGKEFMHKLLTDIDKAEKYINIEYFIIKHDHVGLDLIRHLTKKAREGVEVRLLVDALGSRFINNMVLRDFLRAGGKVGYFFKPKFKIIGIKFNYRNHRKIVVIDDKIGYTGGYNIAKEYLGEKKKFGYWRDANIRIKGDSVYELNARFTLDWRFTTNEKLEILPETIEKNSDNVCGVQIVSCGPESPAQEVKRAFMRMITFAERKVYIQTPYFVPDPPILESLKMAAQSGLDVRLMIPCKPDHMFVYWATFAYAGELLKNGVRVFIYDGGFLHAKTMVVDGEISTVGSTNFDNRSFKLNFETNAFIFDEDFTKELESSFKNDIPKCHELTLEMYNKRNVIIRFKEQVSKLLSEIL